MKSIVFAQCKCRKLLVALTLILLVSGFVVLPLHPISLTLGVAAQTDPIEEMMSQMSVADRVGQLFIVTFLGNDVRPTSKIARLIRDYHIGGVVLLPSNENFHNDSDTPQEIAKLTNGLQYLAYQYGREGTGDESSEKRETYPFVPLFIAIEHAGDSYPHNSIGEGLTSLPSEMALGATWQPEDALAVGEIAGRELSALGLNMILGPSLDVLNIPRPGLKGDIGTYSFGGDPFWTGKFGRAYIRGVHQGSKGQVITVARHFPGLGAADRHPYEEIPTVPKSLSELRSIELAPFMAVTTGNDLLSITDALMSSHIRYRGFQGNIRQLTRPISLDPQNLQTLLSEPEFMEWRNQGGIMVTDGLGVPAIRRYYDPQLQTFPYKRIAQDAFLAGNDLLFLFQYGLIDDAWDEQYNNIEKTIAFFQEKYVIDPDFQAQVDESVRRILHAKHRMYGEFGYERTVTDLKREGEERGLGVSSPEISRIAKEAITLIYPGADDLADRLPTPPSFEDDILIFTDVREFKDCENCPAQPIISADAFESVMVRLYGPNGSAQIDPQKVHSLTFSQLKESLLFPPGSRAGSTADVNDLIDEADWIIFAMLDVNLDKWPASDSVKTFLDLRSDTRRDKKIIVMAYGAPYYLDTTEMSKLTAYYGVYSKIEPFIETSVRTLFQEYTPGGALPVSVEGINYDLITQTAPDPKQVIQVQLANEPNTEAGESIDVTVGSTLRLKTGMILDRNGHPVPDGTPVRFRLTYPAEKLELPRREDFTTDGMAETSITLEHLGQLEVTASSDPASQSTPLVLTIRDEKPTAITTLIPTASVTTTLSVTASLPLSATPGVTGTASSTTSSHTTLSSESESTPRVRQVDLWIALIGMVSLNIMGDILRLRGGRTRTYRLRLILIGILFGLGGYMVYALGILGTWGLWPIYRQWGAVFFGMFLSVIPLMTVLVAQGVRATRHARR